MNKKKYIGIGIFMVVITLGAGVAYYFDTPPIETVSDADISLIDSVSSSFPALDDQTSSDVIASSPSPVQKTIKKKITTSKKVVTSSPPDELRNSSDISLPLQSHVGDVTGSAPTSFSSSTSMPAALCSFPMSAPSTTRKIIFNELAWMGSPSSSSAEWIEVKNISADTIDMSGWRLADASGKIKISFSGDDTIASGGLSLLSRGSTGGSAAQMYSGDLTNTGDALALMNPQCDISDYLDASRGWPAGDNTTKQTLERNADSFGWHTSALPGGTPDIENSAGPVPTRYKLIVAFQGDTPSATIMSDPVGLMCGVSCSGSFASGTEITLTPLAGQDTTFGGWSGMCYGETICSFIIDGNMSLTASFHLTLPFSTPASNQDFGILSDVLADASDTPISSSSAGVVSPSLPPLDSGSSAAAASHILISALQIAGASSNNDLIKLYNPTGITVDMSGWKLHKKSQTGTDYSLKVFPAGSTLIPGQLFTWANSLGGFSETIGANVSSTETLSADNSVALMDTAGSIVDAIAWGTGNDQYGEGSPYPTSPGANQLLSRRSSGGVMIDTDNNTNDFNLQ